LNPLVGGSEKPLPAAPRRTLTAPIKRFTDPTETIDDGM
jgi:hypothetical protein